MKMWDGRFTKASDRLMEQFNNSLPFDRELIEHDIAGSVAWAQALRKAGVLTAAESGRIVKGLRRVLREHRAGTLAFDRSDEDIHMAVERLLVERIGVDGKKLHTGRSRNDQVATDFRLYAKERLRGLAAVLSQLRETVLARAQKDLGVVMPGFTHLQQAQPVLVSHYWLSLFWALGRDHERLLRAADAADVLALGSGAIAGAGFPVDRRFLARRLGFATVSPNSMDAVASRDFALEALAAVSSLAVTLSRYAEDLIIWSSKEFHYVELDDAWATGSSMMPQKKNPDALELIRGKCGRFIGNYLRLATTLKGVGMTYCKDLQEDKEPLFDSGAQMDMVLRVFSPVLATLTLDRTSIAADLDPFLFATDLADYLVERGVPFRRAHEIVGKIVAWCIKRSKPLDKMKLSDLKRHAPEFRADVMRVFRWESALAHRSVAGGTSRKSVDDQIRTARRLLRRA